MVLGKNGAIVERGSYEKLKNARGYVQSLDLAAGTGMNSSNAGEPREQREEREVRSELTAQELAAAATAESDANDIKQTTDASTWMYYARALGWFRIAALVLLLTIKAALGCLQCLSQLIFLFFLHPLAFLASVDLFS